MPPPWRAGWTATLSSSSTVSINRSTSTPTTRSLSVATQTQPAAIRAWKSAAIGAGSRPIRSMYRRWAALVISAAAAASPAAALLIAVGMRSAGRERRGVGERLRAEHHLRHQPPGAGAGQDAVARVPGTHRQAVLETADVGQLVGRERAQPAPGGFHLDRCHRRQQLADAGGGVPQRARALVALTQRRGARGPDHDRAVGVLVRRHGGGRARAQDGHLAVRQGAPPPQLPPP